MTAVRVLLIDDEADIREVVELSLALDPGFVTRTCASGLEALPVALDWQPHLILLDVMMPVLDGPATLSRLRDCTQTACIPVVFMTARAQTRELDAFRSLGAVGVIPKPFDPMTLASSVRSYLPQSDPFVELRNSFMLRLKKDIATLTSLVTAVLNETNEPIALSEIRQVAHGLAGAGAIYGFSDISKAAATLEDVIVADLDSPRLAAAIKHAMDHLISCSKMEDSCLPAASLPLLEA